MNYELSNENDFEEILEILSNELNADNIGTVHGFFQKLPRDYPIERVDLEYLQSQGLDGLENLSDSASYFMSLKSDNLSQFNYFAKTYSDFVNDLESVLTEVNSSFSVTQSSLSRAKAGATSTHLVNADMAQKNGVKKTYRMTESLEDYRMVESLIEKIGAL